MKRSREYLIAVSIGFALTVLFSYQLLWYAHKYSIPWSGLGDFAHYHDMTLHPLDFDATRYPFNFRMLTPLIASLLLKSHAIYDNATSFDAYSAYKGVRYDKSVFFALLFANYLAVAGTGALLYAHAAIREGRRLSLYGLLSIAALLLTFNTLVTTIAPVDEGWSWFLLLAIFLLMRQEGRIRYLALPLIVLSIFQRELLSPIVFLFAASELFCMGVARAASLRGRAGFLWLVAGVCVLASSLYAALALFVLPPRIPGLETNGRRGFLLNRMKPRKILAGLSSLSALRQSVLNLNTMAAWLGLEYYLRASGDRARGRGWNAVTVGIGAGFLFVLMIGITIGGGNNVGRYLALLTPIVVLRAVEILRQIWADAEEEPQGTAA